jgi:hypothetical protein
VVGQGVAAQRFRQRAHTPRQSVKGGLPHDITISRTFRNRRHRQPLWHTCTPQPISLNRLLLNHSKMPSLPNLMLTTLIESRRASARETESRPRSSDTISMPRSARCDAHRYSGSCAGSYR